MQMLHLVGSATAAVATAAAMVVLAQKNAGSNIFARLWRANFRAPLAHVERCAHSVLSGSLYCEGVLEARTSTELNFYSRERAESGSKSTLR